jgi:hypothetical protein
MEQAIKLLKLDQPEPPPSMSWGTPESSDEDLEADFITRFTQLENVTPEAVEQAGLLFRAVERSRKEAAIEILSNLEGSETEAEIVLAAIRSLCAPTERPREATELNRHVMPRG